VDRYRGPVAEADNADAAGPTAADRRVTVVVAGHRGELATVEAHRHDEDPHVRAAFLGALVRLGRLDTPTLDEFLRDQSAIVIGRAITAAAHFDDGDDAIDHALVDLIGGVDEGLAEQAVWALGERWEEAGDDAEATVLDAVEAAAGSHPDALVREAAVASLGSIGAERSLPVILRAAGDKATVRRRAVIALAPFDGPEVDAALTTARVDRDWQVRQAAEDLLAPARAQPSDG
jgi:HEAT repeat protein